MRSARCCIPNSSTTSSGALTRQCVLERQKHSHRARYFLCNFSVNAIRHIPPRPESFDRTNDISLTPSLRQVIGILDIFGFEIFKLNSFEQLCINFANEKLQQHFNKNTFKLETEVYKSEGVKCEEIIFMDNQDVLDLVSFNKRPRGLLQMLDEEIRVPGGNSQTFVKKFKR